MLKIDVHTHILPPQIPRFKEKFGYGGFVQLEQHHACGAKMMRDDGTFFRDVESNCYDPAARLVDCDREGVSVQVLSTVPVMFSYWAKPDDTLELSRFLNDHIAGLVQAHPTRFVGLGTLPMQAPKLAVAEMERCVRDLGLRGVQVGTNVKGKALSDESFFPIYEAAQDFGAAVFVHPWDMLGQERMKDYWLAWLVGMPSELSLCIASLMFRGVFERFPKLRFCFAHGGGSFASNLGRIEHGFLARPDLCAVHSAQNPREVCGKFFLDSLVHDPAILRLILNTFGPSRVALGTDYPFPLGEQRPGALAQQLGELNSEAIESLMSGTALEWLGLKAENFRK